MDGFYVIVTRDCVCTCCWIFCFGYICNYCCGVFLQNLPLNNVMLIFAKNKIN